MLELNFSQTLGNHCLTINETLPANGITAIFGVSGAGKTSLISQLKSLEIDLFIFSCEGIDSSGALWDSNAINADYKSMLLKRAAQSLLLIDKSKFNRSGEARIGHLDEVTHIISDERQVATSLVTA